MLFKLALDNIRRSFRSYWAYFLSSAFSVFVLYLFLSITYGKAAASIASYQAFSAIFMIGAVLTVLFTAFFIWYSNTFFIKTRKKEFATYMLLGMSKKQTMQLAFMENLVILALSFAAGIAAGILLNKFLIMALLSFLQASAVVPFEICSQALKVCSLVYLGVFALISVHSILLLNKASLIDLINASKKAEKVLKVSARTYLMAIAAVALLGLGYFMSIMGPVNPLFWMLIVASVCIGTWLFFASVAALYFHFSRRNEAKFYSGTRLITISQLMHRFHGNVGVLSVIAVTTSVALCALLTCSSLSGTVEKSSREMYPFSVEYNNTANNADSVFQDTVKKHPEIAVKTSVKINLLRVATKPRDAIEGQPYFLIKQSDYNQALEALGRTDRVNIADESDCVLVRNNGTEPAPASLTVYAAEHAATLAIQDTRKGAFISLYRFLQTLVVKDSVYSSIVKASGEKEYSLTEAMLGNDMVAGSFLADLHKQMAAENKPLAFFDNYMDGLRMRGVMLFVGVFIGLLFVAATGSILYFRLIMEANEDRDKYSVLLKLGVSRNELRSAIAKQVGIVFGLPFALAVVNSFAALFQLEKMLRMANTAMVGTFLIVVAVYSVFFGAYYLLTLNKYVRTVGSGN